MYNSQCLVILDADGTTINAFDAIQKAFKQHHLNIGDLERFQKRRHLFKYLGGLKEFPKNLIHLSKKKRYRLIDTLTMIYREEACLYPGIPELMQRLIAEPSICVGVVTRNITNNAEETLRQLFKRHQVNAKGLDFLLHVPLKEQKLEHFRQLREQFKINPARAYACGDEKTDFIAAVGSFMSPFMVSYGFEDYERLTQKLNVPGEIISRTPQELCGRLLHALGKDKMLY